MELPPLLRLSYWFDLTPPPFTPWVENFLLVFFGLFLFVGLFVRLLTLKSGWEKMTKRLLIRISGALMILGLFGLALYGLTVLRIYGLSMRFGYLLWLALFVWYIYRNVKYVWVEIPELARKREERERFEKWLPKKGK